MTRPLYGAYELIDKVVSELVLVEIILIEHVLCDHTSGDPPISEDDSIEEGFGTESEDIERDGLKGVKYYLHIDCLGEILTEIAHDFECPRSSTVFKSVRVAEYPIHEKGAYRIIDRKVMIS